MLLSHVTPERAAVHVLKEISKIVAVLGHFTVIEVYD